MEVALAVAFGDVQEFQQVGVAEDSRPRGAILSTLLRLLAGSVLRARTGHIDLPGHIDPARTSAAGCGQAQVEFPFLRALGLGQDVQVVTTKAILSTVLRVLAASRWDSKNCRILHRFLREKPRTPG